MIAKSPVHVRPMIATDLETVLGIADSLPVAPQWPRDAYLRALDAAASVKRLALVAEEPASGRILGLMVASLTPPEAELETIAVAAIFQRRGVGRTLLHHAMGELRSRKVSEVTLEVRASNDSAIGLYAKNNFREVGRRLHYYSDPVEDAILMWMKI